MSVETYAEYMNVGSDDTKMEYKLFTVWPSTVTRDELRINEASSEGFVIHSITSSGTSSVEASYLVTMQRAAR